MIRDLSETLRALLDDPALAADYPDLATAQVVFERPADGFKPNQPTIDVYLYDVRENMELRAAEPRRIRAGDTFTLSPAPLRVACSYLVTAWPVGGTDLPLQEHRLLSQALQVLGRYPHVPPALAKGRLKDQTPPIPLVAARADGLKEPHEFWAAIGNKLRPSLVVTATIALDVFPTERAPAVTAAVMRLGLSTSGGGLAPSTPTERTWLGGRVTQGAQPAADADVEIVEAHLAARTDQDGRFVLGTLAPGGYTLRVKKGSAEKSKHVVVPPASAGAYDIEL